MKNPSVAEENATTSSALTATVTLEPSEEPEHKSIKAIKVCDLPECLREYSIVRAELTAGEKRAAELGKIPGEKAVSYVEVKRDSVPENELKKYKIGKVNFLSSPEQCDKILGTPKVKTKKARRYSYQSAYEICLSFSGKGKMKEMGIYKDSREVAKKIYHAFAIDKKRYVEPETARYYKRQKNEWQKIVFPKSITKKEYNEFLKKHNI